MESTNNIQITFNKCAIIVDGWNISSQELQYKDSVTQQCHLVKFNMHNYMYGRWWVRFYLFRFCFKLFREFCWWPWIFSTQSKSTACNILYSTDAYACLCHYYVRLFFSRNAWNAVRVFSVAGSTVPESGCV